MFPTILRLQDISVTDVEKKVGSSMGHLSTAMTNTLFQDIGSKLALQIMILSLMGGIGSNDLLVSLVPSRRKLRSRILSLWMVLMRR